MAFANRIRLPFQLIRAQFPESREVYRRSDGDVKTLSVSITKKYEGETDYMPEKWHERLTIALAHDDVSIESDRYVGGIVKDGDYQIDWPKFLDYPTAKAAFTVNVTPFDGTNSNCMTCEEATQLTLANDTFPDPLDEDTDYTLQVETNDQICCYPAVFSITSFDSTYFSSVTIDDTGLLTVHTLTGLTSINGLKVCTYRVTCSNGAYDEADVFADINGSIAATCLAPENVQVTNITSTDATPTWDAPTPAPDHYFWKLYKGGVLVASGDVATTSFSFSDVPYALDPGADDYDFFVRSQCDPSDDDATGSNFIEVPFSASTASGLCGQYSFFYNCPLCPNAGMGGHINVSYIDCNGLLQTGYAPNNIHRAFCLLQTAPGAPVYINAGGDPNFTYSYDTLCP